MKCKQDYGLVGNYENETIQCLDLNELKSGRYVKVSNYFLYNLVSCKNIFLYF